MPLWDAVYGDDRWANEQVWKSKTNSDYNLKNDFKRNWSFCETFPLPTFHRRTHQQSLAWGIQWYPRHMTRPSSHIFTLISSHCSRLFAPLTYLPRFVFSVNSLLSTQNDMSSAFGPAINSSGVMSSMANPWCNLFSNPRWLWPKMWKHNKKIYMKYHEIILMKRIRSPFYGLVGCCDSFLKIRLKQGQQDTILQWTPGVVHVFVEVPQADLSIAQQLAFSSGVTNGNRRKIGVNRHFS